MSDRLILKTLARRLAGRLGNPACARTRQKLWFEGTMEGSRDHRQVRGNSQVGLRRRS